MELPRRVKDGKRAFRDHFTLFPGSQTFPGPDVFPGFDSEAAIAELLREPPPAGRPSKELEHSRWTECFIKFRDELNGPDFHSVNGEKPLNNIELSQLVVDELNLTVTSRAVWNAVKEFLKP